MQNILNVIRKFIKDILSNMATPNSFCEVSKGLCTKDVHPKGGGGVQDSG